MLSFTFTLSGFAAVVFTNDTLVNSFDTTYDGSDIVVSNCTLTVDGPHGFLSLLVGPGATVTHSYSSSGNIAVLHSVTNEPQTLTGTNPASLAYTGTLVTQTVTDSGSSITYTQDVDYVMLPPGAGTIQIARTATSAIPDGATVLVSYTVQVSTPAGLTLSITGNVQVAAGGAINVNGRGYGSGIGLGAGRPSNTSPADGSGGSYGGLGGTSSSNAIAGSTYGFFDGPAFLGSGGGAGASGGQGAPGGGLIKISAGGNINVDGALLANGADATNSRAGGGAGGSIWLIGSSVSGSGSLVANGGAGEPIHGGGGGGGRISIGADTITLSGPRTAYGGNGWQFGGAGTVYTSRSNGIDGAVLVDNGGHAGTNTLLNVTTGVDVTVRNAGVVATTTWSVRNLVIASNAFVQASAGPLLLFNVNATGNVTVQAGGALLVDRAGYGPGTGPGAGGYFTSQNTILCGGGGHGGYGGGVSVTNTAGGNVYDSQTGPNIFGSGGGYGPSLLSGYGGGSIHITLSGALQVDGRLSANGGDAIGVGGGGGSGGSIWISAGTLLGNGTISANGGNGNDSLGGGGGGGRVALTVTSNNFIGTISAYGGGGANWGGAGPLYLQVYSGPGATNQLIVDNGGHAGTNSAIQPALTSTALILRNGGAAVQNFPPMTFSTLFIGSNCWLRANTPGGNYPGQANLTVTGNATIQAGGGIVTDAMGSGPGTGQGAGRLVTATPYYYAGGGGHGGYGGGYAPNQFVGGIYYDQPITPSLNGSGGGHLPPNYIGGAGGGWVRLTVNGTLQLDGRLSANGGNAAGFGGGGGSGGSVWLTLGKLTGAGAITANGGNGASITSGGGGGGRIAISFNTNSFAGVISAYGGGPTNWGGAGSIYIRTNSAAYGTMVLDNGGNAGTNSGFLDIPTVDLIVAAGAISPAGSVHNLLIRSNGTVAPFSFAGSPQNINVSGNATIEPGGAISLDGLGYGPGSGPGSGFGNYTGIRGGGGHGGLGAANPIGRGGSYDSITSPNMPGSGGGSASGTSVAPFGGAGGGALNLTILGNGILTVNGRISANGQNGDANSGGGAGGALSINTTTLAGSGSISANGGAGQGSAGGGGGGRIFITWTSNLFTGPVTAAGGNGLVAGGAGTVYLKPRTLSTGQLFIDNGGLVGTNTPLSTVYSLPPSPFNLTISGGGAAMPMTPLPLLSNLTVGTASLLTSVAGQSNLVLAVLGNVNVLTNGSISVAGRGYPQAQGPGAGSTLSSKGAGGGYGGAGGASASGAAGGTNYGSATQPVDRGSGGGLGANTLASGSDGGGALRLSVGGTLNVAGTLSADGNVGLQDDSGGGSGGSIWISANHISGAGAMTANGGNGDLYGGGGGGGGRIAIYSPANTYTGLVTMVGGAGANFGEPGTLHTSNSFLPFQVISSTPSGVLTTLVSFVDLTFNEVVNNYAVSASGFTLNTPNGPLPQINLSAFALSPSTVRVSFPPQSTPGDYLFQLSSGVTSLLGQPISQVYTGMFTIVLPTISGAVTNSSGQGVAGVLMQPNDVFAGVTTDANGNYSLGVPYGWNGTITPALGTSMFVPSFLSFNNVSTPVTGQNFLVVPTIAPLLSSSVSGGNFNLSWPGIAGVSYQAYSSTNLTDWLPVGGSLPGTNGLMQFVTPLDGQPLQFFRIQASD